MKGAACLVSDAFRLSAFEYVYGGMILQLNLVIVSDNTVQGLPGLVCLAPYTHGNQAR
jgi:hypothetical protein